MQIHNHVDKKYRPRPQNRLRCDRRQIRNAVRLAHRVETKRRRGLLKKRLIRAIQCSIEDDTYDIATVKVFNYISNEAVAHYYSQYNNYGSGSDDTLHESGNGFCRPPPRSKREFREKRLH